MLVTKIQNVFEASREYHLRGLEPPQAACLPAIICLRVAEQHSRGGGVTGGPDGGGPARARPQPAAGLPGGTGGPLLCRGDSGTACLQTRGLDPGQPAAQHHSGAAGACGQLRCNGVKFRSGSFQSVLFFSAACIHNDMDPTRERNGVL